MRAHLAELTTAKGATFPGRPSKSSTRSSRRHPSSCAARSAATCIGVALAAEWQSAGRGRRGRAWTAIAGGSLTFSLGWKFEQGAASSPGCRSPSGSPSFARSRPKASRSRAQVAERPHPSPPQGRRHPDRVERRCARPTTTVIGVGLNVRIPAAARKDIPVPVTDLASIAGAGRPDRPQPPARGVARGARRRSSTCTRTKDSRRSPPNGSTVTPTRASRCGCCCRTGDGHGQGAGVDASGALVLADGPRRARFLSGEITLRRA